MKKTSIYTIARAAGVSPATVSKIINRQGNISRETSLRVMEIIKRYNFVPQQKKLEGRTIGVLTFLMAGRPLASPFMARLLNGICHEAFNRERDVTLIDGKRLLELAPEELHCYFVSNSLCGLLVTNTAWEDPFCERLYASGIPFVLVANETPEKSIYNFVSSNNYDSVSDLLDYMVCMGHSRIAYVGLINQMLESHRERLRAYMDVLKRHKIRIRKEFILDLPNAEKVTIKNELIRLFSRPEPPTALFYASEDLSEIWTLLKQRGISVPGDLSVAGMRMGGSEPPLPQELSSIIQPTEELGIAGVHALLEHIETRKSVHCVLKNTVLYGDSIRKVTS